MARYQFSYGDDDDSSSEIESKPASSPETPSSNTQLDSQSSNPLPCTSPPSPPLNLHNRLHSLLGLANEKPTSPSTPPRPPTIFNPHPGITPRRSTKSKRPFLPPLTPSLPLISHPPTSSSLHLPPSNPPDPSPHNPTISSSQHTCTCTCTPTLRLLLLQTTLLTESNSDQTARLLALHTLYRESRDERKANTASLQKLTHALEKITDSITWYQELIDTQEREISEAETNRQEVETARKEAEKKSQEMEEKMRNLEREMEQWRILWEESERGAGGL